MATCIYWLVSAAGWLVVLVSSHQSSPARRSSLAGRLGTAHAGGAKQFAVAVAVVEQSSPPPPPCLSSRLLFPCWSVSHRAIWFAAAAFQFRATCTGLTAECCMAPPGFLGGSECKKTTGRRSGVGWGSSIPLPCPSPTSPCFHPPASACRPSWTHVSPARSWCRRVDASQPRCVFVRRSGEASIWGGSKAAVDQLLPCDCKAANALADLCVQWWAV
jgi:hypothetical protein